MSRSMTIPTSTPVLTYFADSPEIQQICKDFGCRLEVLSNIEKFHVAMALAGVLAHWATLADDADDDDEFADLFDPLDDEEATIAGWAAYNLAVEMGGDAIDVLKALEPLQPEQLAALLPAIAQYAAEDNR